MIASMVWIGQIHRGLNGWLTCKKVETMSCLCRPGTMIRHGIAVTEED
jgi:hypothetical protein